MGYGKQGQGHSHVMSCTDLSHKNKDIHTILMTAASHNVYVKMSVERLKSMSRQSSEPRYGVAIPELSKSHSTMPSNGRLDIP